MAFFKFRKSSDESAAPAPAPESAETLRRRARYRLAGAAFLVIAGVIGFPLLFDNQPRPIAVDIPIEIPDKAKVKPLPGAAELAATAPEAASSRAAAGSVASAGVPAASPAAAPAQPAKPAAPSAKPDSNAEEVIVSTPSAAVVAKPEVKTDTKQATKPDSKPAAQAQSKPDVKTDAKTSEAAKAQALLDGKAPETKPAAPAGIRYIVQFGAYSDAAKAHEARVKVEKTGLKTYAQAVDGPDGKKYRVRVGPFASKAEAEKAAEKIKKLDLPAAILEL